MNDDGNFRNGANIRNFRNVRNSGNFKNSGNVRSVENDENFSRERQTPSVIPFLYHNLELI